MSRVWAYSRGSEYSCNVHYNPYASAISFSEVKFPDNTPADVKEAFLEEAQEAVLKQIEEQDDYAARY